jgi:hypothetical protein
VIKKTSAGLSSLVIDRDREYKRNKMQENINDYKRRIHKVFESAKIKLGSMISDLFGVTMDLPAMATSR